MTRVLHLDHTSTVSGAQHSLLTLLAELRRRRTVELAAPPGDLAGRAAALGVEVVAVRGTDASWSLGLRTPLALGGIARAGMELRRVTRAREVQVVHANSIRAGLIAAAALRLGGPPFVVHARDVLPPGRAAATVRALLLRESAGVIAVSGFIEDAWRGGPASVTRIHNPIDCERFAPDPADGARWRERHGVPPGAPLLAVVGQITPWKRQQLAVEAFAELLGSHPEARLVIAGEVKFAGREDNAAYLSRLRSRVAEPGLQERVQLLGEREDVPSLLRAADVLVAPARDEPFGRAVAEALATGTPAVVAARGGSVEFLRDGSDGVVVGEDGAWAGGCRRALELAAVPELAAARRARACELLSARAHADAVDAVLTGAAR